VFLQLARNVAMLTTKAALDASVSCPQAVLLQSEASAFSPESMSHSCIELNLTKMKSRTMLQCCRLQTDSRALCLYLEQRVRE
jgi:hypothetical protein